MDASTMHARSVARAYIHTHILTEEEWEEFDTFGMIEELVAAKLDGIPPFDYIADTEDVRIFRAKYAL